MRGSEEKDIINFQKEIKNLPDFDLTDNPYGHSIEQAQILSEMGRSLSRPRSRSMPRVTYESSRYLALPDASFSTRLHRGLSAGAIGFQSDMHGTYLFTSPVMTPTDDRRPSATQTLPSVTGIATGNSNSRRSSLSPASDRNTRRRDSPACLQTEIPPRHRAILLFVEVRQPLIYNYMFSA